MPKVISYKKLKNETETIMSYGDVLRIIEEELGSEVVDALFEFGKDEDDTPDSKMITYIEDGTFSEQIKESGLITRLRNYIIHDLKELDYLKKNKNIDKYEINEDEVAEIIDEYLSPGMMKYFGD